MNRVESAERGVLALSTLRAVTVVWQRQRHDLSLLYEPRRGDDILGKCMIQGPNLVVIAPAAPILQAFGCGSDIVHH